MRGVERLASNRYRGAIRECLRDKARPEEGIGGGVSTSDKRTVGGGPSGVMAANRGHLGVANVGFAADAGVSAVPGTWVSLVSCTLWSIVPLWCIVVRASSGGCEDADAVVAREIEVLERAGRALGVVGDWVVGDRRWSAPRTRGGSSGRLLHSPEDAARAADLADASRVRRRCRRTEIYV